MTLQLSQAFTHLVSQSKQSHQTRGAPVANSCLHELLLHGEGTWVNGQRWLTKEMANNLQQQITKKKMNQKNRKKHWEELCAMAPCFSKLRNLSSCSGPPALEAAWTAADTAEDEPVKTLGTRSTTGRLQDMVHHTKCRAYLSGGGSGPSLYCSLLRVECMVGFKKTLRSFFVLGACFGLLLIRLEILKHH